MWDLFRSLLFQPQCPLCRRSPAQPFCRDCEGQIREQEFTQNSLNKIQLLPCFVWGRYEGGLKRALTVMKFHNQPQIGPWLGEQLAYRWLAQNNARRSQHYQVVPIPLHPNKQQQRGFNQAEKIAQGFCRLTGYPLRPRALERSRNTQALFSLSPGDRQREIQGALDIGAGFNTQQPWLIVDDIVTTGTTAQEAQRVITSQGGKVATLLAIATPKS